MFQIKFQVKSTNKRTKLQCDLQLAVVEDSATMNGTSEGLLSLRCREGKHIGEGQGTSSDSETALLFWTIKSPTAKDFETSLTHQDCRRWSNLGILWCSRFPEISPLVTTSTIRISPRLPQTLTQVRGDFSESVLSSRPAVPSLIHNDPLVVVRSSKN